MEYYKINSDYEKLINDNKLKNHVISFFNNDVNDYNRYITNDLSDFVSTILNEDDDTKMKIRDVLVVMRRKLFFEHGLEYSDLDNVLEAYIKKIDDSIKYGDIRDSLKWDDMTISEFISERDSMKTNNDMGINIDESKYYDMKNGVFSTVDITGDEITLGIAFERKKYFTCQELGKVGHSSTPNCKLSKYQCEDNSKDKIKVISYFLATSSDIKKGDELTIDYNNLRNDEDFDKNIINMKTSTDINEIIAFEKTVCESCGIYRFSINEKCDNCNCENIISESEYVENKLDIIFEHVSYEKLKENTDDFISNMDDENKSIYSQLMIIVKNILNLTYVCENELKARYIEILSEYKNMACFSDNMSNHNKNILNYIKKQLVLLAKEINL